MYLTAAGALVVLARLVKDWKQADELDKWGAVAFIVYVLHIWEENRFPGGYWYLVNNTVPNYPMNTVSYMLTNIICLAAALAVLFHGMNNVSSTVFAAVLASETAHHCVRLIRQSLVLSGLFYAPGFVTALLGFLPLAMVQLVKVIERRPRYRHLCLGFALSVIFIFIIIYLPEILLRDPVSPYAFTDPGFYSR